MSRPPLPRATEPRRSCPLPVCRVAPVGLCPYWCCCPQGLVALTGLRTLGFGGVAPIGAWGAEYEEARLALPRPQGLVALTGLRTLGFGGVAPIGAWSAEHEEARLALSAMPAAYFCSFLAPLTLYDLIHPKGLLSPLYPPTCRALAAAQAPAGRSFPKAQGA